MLSVTIDAAERFNRKMEKCFSGRYGIPTRESAQVLLWGLSLKALLQKGHQHRSEISELASLNVSRTS